MLPQKSTLALAAVRRRGKPNPKFNPNRYIQSAHKNSENTKKMPENAKPRYNYKYQNNSFSQFKKNSNFQIFKKTPIFKKLKF